VWRSNVLFISDKGFITVNSENPFQLLFETLLLDAKLFYLLNDTVKRYRQVDLLRLLLQGFKLSFLLLCSLELLFFVYLLDLHLSILRQMNSLLRSEILSELV
jgi:hypothetical protein